ncbi:hypothetical protein N9W17_06210 [Jannaschia sp.]|nr:hypothetical protein [Jannaschia sp.]
MTLSLLPRDPRIHVFSVSDGPMSLAHQTYLSPLEDLPRDATPLREAFGAEIDATYAEVFAVTDIAPMSLRDYLGQAHDVPSEALAPEATRLDALSGDVAVLAPRAVEGVAVLHPRPELTHIGSFAPAEADFTPGALPEAGAAPAIATPAVATGAPLQQRTITWVVLAGLALVVALALLL